MSGNWSSQSPERQAINDYSFTDELVRKDWAWETLRRNPHYYASWLEARPYFEIVAETDHQKVVIAHKTHSALDRWGCLYSDEPSIDARTAAVLWQPEKMTGVLRMTSHLLDAAVDAGRFSLNEMQIPSVLLLMPECKQSVLFLDSGRGLQVSVSGETLRQPVLLSADAVPRHGDYKRQIKLLASFKELRITGRLCGNLVSSRGHQSQFRPSRRFLFRHSRWWHRRAQIRNAGFPWPLRQHQRWAGRIKCLDVTSNAVRAHFTVYPDYERRMRSRRSFFHLKQQLRDEDFNGA